MMQWRATIYYQTRWMPRVLFTEPIMEYLISRYPNRVSIREYEVGLVTASMVQSNSKNTNAAVVC